jgi:hypothetical protein
VRNPETHRIRTELGGAARGRDSPNSRLPEPIRSERGAAGPLFVAAAPAVALGSEAGQGMGLVPGTFDWVDAFSAAAAALAAFIVYRNRGTRLS